MAAEVRSPDPLADGLERLREADWPGARAAFEVAIASTETAAAREGLSWAAWWLDDRHGVFDSRERAYRLYKRSGDRQGAARMATWLACDELDFHGAASVASGWLGRARRLLDGVEPGPDHGWLAFHEGYLAMLAGDADRTSELGAKAAELGRRCGVADLEMLGLALEGTVHIARAQIAAGMRCLDEASAAAISGEADIPISGAWACCFLVSACVAVSDYERASEWCDRIGEFARQYGSRYMLAFCRAEYGAIHLWRGQWDDAERMLEGAIEDFTRSRPAMVGGPLAWLAELRRRQGREAEAVELLDRAGPSLEALRCRALIALDRGDPRRAIELAERQLRQIPLARRLERWPALQLLARGHLARGELDEADSAIADLQDIASAVGTEPLRASTELLKGLLAAARGEHELARTVLEDAADRFERCGAPFDAATTRIDVAASLTALGRADQAEQEASAALDSLTRLGAETEAARARSLLRLGKASEPAGVTPREREVLGLLAMGLTNRQIAARLVISEHTVHRHVTNLLRKLDLPSRTAAAAHAVRSGLLDR